MRFMMIVKATKQSEAGMPPNQELIGAVSKASQEMSEAGVLLANGGLLPSSAGARINVSGQKLFVTDGPFAETRELIGGFAILKANSRAEAVEMGKAFMQLHADILGPSYEGELEIRQMMEMENFSCVHETKTA
jgi:hypothetical protein